MDLRLLKHFLAVVEAGSISAAAEQLNLTQPALSRQVQQLERQIGVRLFDRGPSRLELSAGGQRLVALARGLVDRAGDVRDAVRRIASGDVAHFRVACPDATVRGVIAPFVAATGAPILDTTLDIASRVYAHLTRRDVDLAVSTMPPPLDLVSRLIGTAAIWAYFPVDHSLAEFSSIRAQDLVGHPLIVLTPGSGLRRVIDEALWEVRGRIEVAAEPVSSELALALAAAGKGVCIDLGDAPFGLQRRPILGPDGRQLRMPMFAAWEADHFAAREIELLVDRLHNWGATEWADTTSRAPNQM